MPPTLFLFPGWPDCRPLLENYDNDVSMCLYFGGIILYIYIYSYISPPDQGTTYENAAEQMHRARTGKGEGDRKHRFWTFWDVWGSYRRL